MSLPRAVTAGTLVGAVAAIGIFVSLGPEDLGRVAQPAPPTFAPVPTPTVTELADCTPPAVLKKGFCVTTKPGPKVTLTVPSTRTTTTTTRTAPAPRPPATQEPGDEDEHEHDDDDEHEDDHDDDD